MIRKTLFTAFIFVIFTISINIENTKTKASSIFPDASGHWAEEAINYLNRSAVVNGLPSGHFGVQNNISRKDAALMIARAKNLDLSNVSRRAPFTDLEAGTYYYEAVVAASDAGYLSGYPDRTFRPDGNLTRAEMASILVKAYALENNGGDVFRDVRLGSWQFEPVQTLVSHNITSGYPDGSFRPDHSISRAEFSMLLARAMDERFRPSTNVNPSPNPSPTPSIGIDYVFMEEKSGKFVVNGISLGMKRDEVLAILGHAIEEKLPDENDAFRGDGKDPNYLLADYGEISLEYYAEILTRININMDEKTYEQDWYKALRQPYKFHENGPYMFYAEGKGHLFAHREGVTQAWLTWADGNFYDGLELYYGNQGDQREDKEDERDEEPVFEGKNRYGNSHGNINNAGVFAGNENEYYFAGDDGIYKFVGTSRYLLSDDNNAAFLNVLDGWLYYSVSGSNNPTEGMYRMRTDGTDRTLLTNEYGMYINVVGDWLYYTSHDSLYKMRTDGTDRTYLTYVSPFGAGQIIVHNDWIYFSAESNHAAGTYKIRTDGTEEVKLLNHSTMDLQIVDEWLYFIGSNRTIGRMSLDGNLIESVFSGASAARMNMDENYIYFTPFDYKGFYRMNHDGSNVVMISDGVVDKINIIGDYVFVLMQLPGTNYFAWYL